MQLAGMASNPYPRPKNRIPNNTTCKLCAPCIPRTGRPTRTPRSTTRPKRRRRRTRQPLRAPTASRTAFVATLLASLLTLVSLMPALLTAIGVPATLTSLLSEHICKARGEWRRLFSKALGSLNLYWNTTPYQHVQLYECSWLIVSTLRTIERQSWLLRRARRVGTYCTLGEHRVLTPQLRHP